jgi:hypothetical protein
MHRLATTHLDSFGMRRHKTVATQLHSRKNDMVITLETLAQRLQSLEAEVAYLREQLTTPPRKEVQSRAADVLDSTTGGFHDEIVTEAPGIDKLRAMLAAHGISPGDEIVCQVIDEMRTEEEDP